MNSARSALDHLHEFVARQVRAGSNHAEEANAALVSLFQPDLAALYVIQRDEAHYQLHAFHPREYLKGGKLNSHLRDLSADAQVFLRAISSGTSTFIRVNSTVTHKREYLPFDSQIQTQAIIPVIAPRALQARTNVIAIAVLSWFGTLPFSPSELDTLASAAGSILSSYFLPRLIHQRHDQHVRFLQNITNFSRRDTDTQYQEFLANLTALFPTRFISLWLFDSLNHTLVLRSFYPSAIDGLSVTFSSFDQAVLLQHHSESGKAILSKLPRIISTTESSVFSNQQFARRHRLNWFISFPILQGDGDPLGVLNIWPDALYGSVQEDTIEEINEYVQYMASTIRTATLLFEEKLFSSYDSFFTGLIEFEDDRPSWDKLAKVVRDQMQCEHCSVFLLDADNFLRLKGTTGLIGNPPYEEVYYKRIDSARVHYEGLTGQALAHDEPLVYHLEFADRYRHVHLGKFREAKHKSGSIIFGQIKDGNSNNIGVIRCVNKKEIASVRPARFTHEDLVAISKISRMVSNIYSKAQLVWDKDVEKDRSFRSLHHELISPVDGILAHVNWISRHWDAKPSPTDWDLKRIKLKFRDIERLSTSLENVVHLVGPHSTHAIPDKQLENLSSILNTCIGFIYPEARRQNIEITLFSNFVPSVMIDSSQMMRVFHNLLSNAIKYANPNVTTRYIRVKADEVYGEVVVGFEDNGIGFLESEASLVFERFKRGSKAPIYAPLGEGLGLYYCQQIVNAHGGRVWISSFAKPTRISLTLPLNGG